MSRSVGVKGKCQFLFLLQLYEAYELQTFFFKYVCGLDIEFKSVTNNNS
jgi:hypothetical protein